jgi:hypothetical protein
LASISRIYAFFQFKVKVSIQVGDVDMSNPLVPLCWQDRVAVFMGHGQQIEKLVQALSACGSVTLRDTLVVRLNRAVLGKVFGAFAVATADGDAALATFGWLLYGYMAAVDPKIERLFLDGIARIAPQLSRELDVLPEDKRRAICDNFVSMLAC